MITRNNYEEYFLLLADNELSVGEAVAVKQFAAQHPDLAEELDILMSCRLENTTMPVFPKEKLLRPAMWDAENLESIQTQLLMLLDGELPSTEKLQLEKQIAANTTLQADWSTLQQTKLAADAIVHPNKESLQRNERKVRPLPWVRWAAAAAIVAGLGWLFQLNQKPERLESASTLASTPLPRQQTSTSSPATPVSIQPRTPVTVTQSGTQSTNIQPAVPVATNRSNNTGSRTSNPQPTQLIASNKQPIVSNSIEENTPVEINPATTRLASADVNMNISSTHSTPTLQVAQLSPKVVALPALASNQKSASFTGSKSEPTAEENDYVTIGGAHVNKQKMRGLFRNVTRTVTRSFTKSKMEPDVYAVR